MIITLILATLTLNTGTGLDTVPACELEDGSTQIICIWDGSTRGNAEGSIVLNLNYGEDYTEL